MLSEHEIDRLVARIVARTDPEQVILFGSYAKGTATRTSDVDLLLVRHTHLPPQRRGEDVLPLVRSLLIPVDLHIYTPEEVREFSREEYSFLHIVYRTGRTLFQRGEARPAVLAPGRSNTRPMSSTRHT